MRRKAIFGALLVIGLGVVLGATVFRTDIAQATGLAQSVTVANTSANPVPVREQGTVPVRSSNEEVSKTFNPSSVLSNECTLGLYTAPEGTELVVEYISARTLPPPGGGAPTAADGRFWGDNGADLPLVFQEQSPGTFVASEPIHYVLPAGVPFLFTGALTGTSSCHFHISFGGYLQPSP